VILRRIVVPLVAAYALFVSMAVAFLRRPVRGADERREPHAGLTRIRPLRDIALTIAGGYLFFLVVVLVFHVWIARDRGALRSAAIGGGFLAFVIAAPLFLAGTWWRWWRQPGR
jgi:Family of unknown function (DUF6256)